MVEKLSQRHRDLIIAQVALIEAQSAHATLNERNAAIQQELDATRNELEEANQVFAAATNKARQFKPAIDKISKRRDEDEEFAELMLSVADMSRDQMEAEITAEEAKLEMTRDTDRNVIREFEERAKKIESLQTQQATFNQRVGDISAAILEIRGKWEPTLDALIERISAKFSESFDRIGCAGEVKLDKPSDDPEELAKLGVTEGTLPEGTNSNFDSWSILLMVKFRENESLNVLDAHRQSGGERAVSTIFYLMALQSLSRSPFRVVDEINQGMDPRNERMVHGRLVDICSENAADNDEDDEQGTASGGQYFLITPKLLTDLSYKRGMKVLCVVSGDYMPDNYGEVDFKRCLQVAKRLGMGARAGASRAQPVLA